MKNYTENINELFLNEEMLGQVNGGALGGKQYRVKCRKCGHEFTIMKSPTDWVYHLFCPECGEYIGG